MPHQNFLQNLSFIYEIIENLYFEDFDQKSIQPFSANTPSLPKIPQPREKKISSPAPLQNPKPQTKHSLWQITRSQAIKTKEPSWKLSMPLIDDCDRDLQNMSFSNITPSKMVIPAAIFIDREYSNEVILFSNLAKRMTKDLLPTQTVLVYSENTIQTLMKNYSLVLLSHSLLLGPLAELKYHTPVKKNNTVIIPIYSSDQYGSNASLKKDLWALLNKLPLEDMQKSL